ncbi:MAG: UDP-2,4-diacetamido-2,4,6-trideoxy-beta-L-altropyranose hydrolase [Thaumarchaeota archaeon]|nr:UDP-2,4-diacetamido-2,4,6-trideoxy-beta-L-altropyranose hydrolase [Nitrososphaerota archaeon]MBI3641326.1 UDP-2,4-diacetamido-2,4,6-trideoxy-beta-L-altropyranose hydrolase [Nitrososphaerota archaeon]
MVIYEEELENIMVRENLFIRVDSGTQIGIGHMMRCFAIAESLKDDIKTSFISRSLPGNLCNLIESKEYKVYRLPDNTTLENYDKNCEIMNRKDAEQTIVIINETNEQADWLIVDHYDLDKRWETRLRPHVKKIVVIDDLANRLHDCDLLIDQNLYDNMEDRYKNLIPNNCQQLLGPQYALLRPEFLEIRKKIRKRKWPIKRILVSFGGSDPTNETSKVLDALSSLDPLPLVDVVIGPSNQNNEMIKQLCSSFSNVKCHYKVDNIAVLMANADLSIGAGGTTTWERCCLGLPTIVTVVSKDQLELTKVVAKRGCVISMGLASKVSVKDYVKAIKSIDEEKWYRMLQEGLNLVDGEGANRVASKIHNIHFQDHNLS